MNYFLLSIAFVAGVLVFLAAVRILWKQPAHAGDELRTCPRFPVNSTCEVFWQDAGGKPARIRGSLRDVSEQGARLKVPRKLQEHILVVFRLPEYHLGGSAWVRRCEPKGFSYELGLRFTGPLSRTV